MGKSIVPELLHRNLVIKGINLLALKNRKFRTGEAIFQVTGFCYPCSRRGRLKVRFKFKQLDAVDSSIHPICYWLE